jgi:hypothetical protein
MSRWITQFNNHAFRQTWEALKTSLNDAKVDDESILTTVEELARLKKVIAYIDALIATFDLDLIPTNTWDNSYSQAQPCLLQINHYNNNRNIAHLQSANTHADNLLSYIRPYMVMEGKSGKALQASAKVYSQAIDEYIKRLKESVDEVLLSIRADKKEISDLYSAIQATHEKIEDFNTKLFGEDQDSESIESQIDEWMSSTEERYEEIDAFHNETLVGSEDEPSTKKLVVDAKDYIFERRGEIDSLLKDVEDDIKELQGFHAKVFGKEAASGQREGGLLKSFEDRVKELGDFERKQILKYNTLNEEIEGLIPGATSAGLATAYKEMKESFTTPILYSTVIYLFSIWLMLSASMIWALDSFNFYPLSFKFIQFSNWETVIKSMMTKLPFYVPVIWLALVASKRRSEYQRLQQEYAHKEALAKSYNSYKKQVEALDDKDKSIQKELINKAVDAIVYNPSQTLDGKHGDNHPLHDLTANVMNALSDIKTKLNK